MKKELKKHFNKNEREHIRYAAEEGAKDQNKHTPESVEEVKDEILFWCSRCGGKYKPLGRVLKWGKHYPAFTAKKSRRNY